MDARLFLKTCWKFFPKKDAKVMLVGPLAKAPIDMMGSWAAAGRPAQSVTLFDGMNALIGDISLK